MSSLHPMTKHDPKHHSMPLQFNINYNNSLKLASSQFGFIDPLPTPTSPSPPFSEDLPRLLALCRRAERKGWRLPPALRAQGQLQELQAMAPAKLSFAAVLDALRAAAAMPKELRWPLAWRYLEKLRGGAGSDRGWRARRGGLGGLGADASRGRGGGGTQQGIEASPAGHARPVGALHRPGDVACAVRTAESHGAAGCGHAAGGRMGWWWVVGGVQWPTDRPVPLCGAP